MYNIDVIFIPSSTLKTSEPCIKGIRLWLEQRERARSGERDVNKAKCEIKVCCFKERRLETCAGCPDYPCEVLGEFWSKRGWKYKQYRKQLEFIRQNGYEEFLKRANKWKGPRGKLEIAQIE